VANLLDDRFVERGPANPFTPGFGVTPSRLVGRDSVLAEIAAGLDIGPKDKRFSAVLLGGRGVGKTVLLNEIEDITAGSGWLNLSVDATTPGLEGRIVAQIEQAGEHHDGLPAAAPDAVERSRKGGLSVRGAAWLSAEERSLFKPRWDLRRRLTALGEVAARRRTGVLITIDELHAADIQELRRFAADMQHVAQRNQLPVAVIAAGLPDLRRTFFLDPKLSFFVRSHHVDVPHITTAQAYAFYRDTLNETGGTVTPEALTVMADGAGPYAIRMQAVGDAAWECANAPTGLIDETIAEEALRQADSYLAGRLYAQVWHDLGVSERRCLALLAAHDGFVRRSDLLAETRAAGVPNPSAAWEGLVVNECVKEDAQGIVEFGPAMSRVAAQRGAMTLPPQPNLGTAAAEAARRARSDPTRRCNEFMPRARRRCVLPAGHNGSCRSTRPGT